jgi:hypothetical protein
VGQRGVEHRDEDVADVVAGPLLEDVDEEPAVLLGPDRAVGDQVALLPVQRPLTGRSPQPDSASGSSSAVTRSTIGMSWTNVAPSSSRRNV